MKITENSIVGQLVAEDYRNAGVFKSYGIDFCCKGNRSIGDVCASKNIAPEEVIAKLNTVMQKQESQPENYTSWPLDLLADYIEKKHHRYVESMTREIMPYLDKVVKVHGEEHPELEEIRDSFMQSAQELAMHMKKEELILFPFIRKMTEAKLKNEPLSPPHFSSVENPVAMMKHEHDIEGERFRQISALSNNYTPPENACSTYKVVFALLKEFEEDLHLHIHLENNILFPAAIELEKELVQLS